MPLLCEAGADKAFHGQLLFYQFFMIPFGDNTSVRPPQVAVDVKMTKAKTAYIPLKQHVHDRAKECPVFNRAEGTRATSFDHLLNFELCSLHEIAVHSEASLRELLTRRLRRFHATIHPEIVSFLQTTLREFEDRS